jgi:predicted N-acetyltransferase YhbS
MMSGLLTSQTGWSDTGERINRGRGEFDRADLITGAQWRRRELGRALVREALARAGGLRIDVLSRSGSYYLSLGAESVPGFRLHKETMV